MQPFADLVLKHAGKRICVMGGGDSLESDLERIKADVYISANEHGIPFGADYILAIDERADDGAQLKSHGVPVISPEHWADYQISGWPGSPRRVFSGLVAIWAAWQMGAHVVYLAGFGGYVGSDDERLAARHANDAKLICGDVRCHVRAVSGPMLDVVPEIRSHERLGKYEPHASLTATDDRITVTVIKSCYIHGREATKGERVTVMRHEVVKQLKHKMVRED